MRKLRMLTTGGQSWRKSRFCSQERARRRRRDFQVQGSVRDARLEKRKMMSADVPVPIPSTNPKVALSTIFWNGGAPLDSGGKQGIPSPAASGAMKTITFTNYATSTIYPFLRTANGGQDPNDSNDGFYDPQD